MHTRVFISGLFCFLVWSSNSLLAEGAARRSGGTASSTVQTPALEATSTNRPAVLSFKLKPTAIAPANAEGTAEVNLGALSLHLSALGQGRYVVRAIRKSDGGAEKIGAVTIIDATLTPSVQATDNKKEASANPEAVSIETDTSLTLPLDLSEHDIARVQVLGRGGNALLDSELK